MTAQTDAPERITLRAERCACGGVIEVREGDRTQDIVACHNIGQQHRAWRERREMITENELRALWGDR